MGIGSSNDYEKEVFLKGSSFKRSAFKTFDKQSEKTICKIIGKHGDTGTGFFCKIPFPDSFHLLPVLITVNHVLNQDDILPGEKINLTLNDDSRKVTIQIDEKRKTYSNEKKYDVTIIEIKQGDNLDMDSFLDVDNYFSIKDLNETFKDKSVFIGHYPFGKNMDYSFGTIFHIREDNYTLKHRCDTEHGSSGGPIINLENYKVLGVHKGHPNGNFKFNLGTYIKGPIEDFYYTIKEKEKESKDEIKIIYKIGQENKIRLFGEDFVKNNKDICKIIYNGKIDEIQEFYYLNKEKAQKDKLEIKLKGIKKLINLREMFADCSSLLYLPDISKLDTSKVIDMSYLFAGCSSLISLPDISRWNTGNVNYLSGLFNKCSSLKTLPDISKWNTRKVKNLRILFQNCSSLVSLPDISKWNTTNVTNMECMFCKCSSLESLPDISKWNINNVTNLMGLFDHCSSLKSLPDISKWNTSKVNNLSYLFQSCWALTSLPDISKWDTTNVINMEAIFCMCVSIISFPDLSKWDTSKVTNMSGIFSNCHSITSLPDISKWNTSNVINMSYLFNMCRYLTSLPDISKWNVGNVKDMKHMFFKCSALSNLPDISNWDIRNVEDMEKMFAGCSSLTSLPDISNWDVNNVNNMDCMFFGCFSLSSLPDISKWNINNKRHNNMFSGCNLKFLKFITFFEDAYASLFGKK